MSFAVSAGLMHSFTVFFVAFLEEFHWSRAETSVAYAISHSARLLPFCEAANDKLLSCLVAVLVRYAAGARAYRIICCKGCESFENSSGSVCV